MKPETYDRLFGYEHAFEHPVTLWVTVALAAVLLLVPGVFILLARMGKIDDKMRGELWQRYFSWLVLIPALLVPILLGAAWTILGIGLLSIFCYQEYARAVGIFREKLLSFLIVIGIVVVTFSVFDHWYRFFLALPSLGIATIIAAAILPDEPKGYVQRVALSILGYSLFGTCMGHLGYMANDPDYRPRIILLLLAVESNDVFAFITGKLFGRRKLCPNTSPNKTIGGAVGAFILTTLLVWGLGQFVYAGRPEINDPVKLLVLGMLISIAGQLGDLALSSLKRDLGLKDMGALIPGHGGLLDRLDSVLLVAPVYFHYVGFFVSFGRFGDQERIFSFPILGV